MNDSIGSESRLKRSHFLRHIAPTLHSIGSVQRETKSPFPLGKESG